MNFNEFKQFPLAEYCINTLNYKVDKKHDSRIWRALESPDGHKIITRSLPNEQGHYLYKSTTGNHCGSIIDLLQKGHGMSLSEIRESNFLTSPHIPQPSRAFLASPKSQPVRITPTAFLGSPTKNYLTRRGICLSTMELFDVGATPRHVVFPLWEFNSTNCFRIKTSIKYSTLLGINRCRFLGPRGGAVSFLKKKLGQKGKNSLRELYIFESPIDALSFFQIEKPDGSFLFLSLCGTPTFSFRQSFPSLVRFLSVQRVLFALDNDDRGRVMTKLLRSLLGSCSVHVLDISNKLGKQKDWNDLLML